MVRSNAWVMRLIELILGMGVSDIYMLNSVSDRVPP